MRLPSSRPQPSVLWERSSIAVLTLAAVAVRAFLFSGHELVSINGVAAVETARAWFGSESGTMAPGYPLLIAMLRALTHDGVLAARLVSFGFGMAVVPLTWFLARYWVGKPALRLGIAAAVAFMPLAVRSALLTEAAAMTAVLLVLSVLFVVQRRWAAAGVIAGLAAATEPVCLLFVVLIAVFATGNRKALIRFAVPAAVTLVALILVGGPHSLGGFLTGPPVDRLPSELWSRDPGVWETWRTGHQQPDPLTPLWNGGGLGTRFGHLIHQVLASAGWIVPLLGLLGLRFGGGLLGLAIAPLLLLPLTGDPNASRWVMPFAPALWILAGVTVERFGQTRNALATTTAGAVLALGVSGWHTAGDYRMPEDGLLTELREVGQWLRENGGASRVVVAGDPRPAFFAGAAAGGGERLLPSGDYEQHIAGILSQGIDYVVLHETSVNVFHPALAPLVEDEGAVRFESRVRPIEVNTRFLGGRTHVFRVVRPGGPEPLPEKERELRHSIAKLPHAPDHALHGRLALLGENFLRAAAEYQLALNEDEENADLNERCAWAMFRAGQSTELGRAEIHARRAVEADPGNPKYLKTLVEILKVTPGKERALELWEGRLREAEKGYTPK